MNRFLLAGGLLLAPASLAFAASCETISSGMTLNPGNITVQRDVATGQPISEWIETPIFASYRNCEFDDEVTHWRVNGIETFNAASSGLSYTGLRVFDTNLSGVGMIIAIDGNNIDDLSLTPSYGGFIPTGRQSGVSWSGQIIKGQKYHATNRVRIRLIKTGTISSGALAGSIAQVYYRTEQPIPTVPITFAGGTISALSCSVTTPNINVPLGKQAKSNFSGVGSGTEWQSFDIQLNCLKGARINVRLDATAAPATTRKDVMRLDPESGDIAAKGVGIQLGYRMGYELELGKTLLYETSKFDTEFIMLRARYYQTEENVIAGKANGTATFTLTYK
ncbi:fimbrial protein [Enterobacter sp. ECC-175]|uniref:fimbrial protein n=1 Tax=Enterobacter sp. ECC-175 TaxID=3116479 RepID=UPI0037550160